MDRKDFNSLGYGVDDLIDAYVQTVLSVIAIDRLCQRLMTENTQQFTIERPLTSQELKLDPEELKQPMLSVSASADAETRTRTQIESIIDRDGQKMACERTTTTERRFDFALFEALNPDKALLQEIKL